MKEIMNFINQCETNEEKLATAVLLVIVGVGVMFACYSFGFLGILFGLENYVILLHLVGKLYSKDENPSSLQPISRSKMEQQEFDDSLLGDDQPEADDEYEN